MEQDFRSGISSLQEGAEHRIKPVKSMGAASLPSFALPESPLGVHYQNGDWSRSALGPIGDWSPSLATTVAMMLGADAQIVLFWGVEFVALYNDSYAPTIGDKHPGALGRPAKESWAELWSDLEPLLRGVRETGRTFSAKDRSFYIERRGFGETVYFDVSYSAVPEADGSVGGVLCIVSETTERVRAEAALRELNETLEQRIAERSRELELANVALRQAQKMEAVGRLTGGIAHDFNNLLQGVMGSFDLIGRRSDDPAHVSRWAAAGMKAAQRGARLASQLLAFSRSQKLHIVPIDITGAVDGFIDVLRRNVGPTIRLHTNLETDGLRVEGDQVQLELAVLNLALNARDAMPDGGDLAIASRLCSMQGDAELPDGDYVELSIKDSGFGMPADVLERAFEPFFTTKESGRSTGLGLSQVYGTLHQSGGTVRLESAPGVGTTVRLYLRKTDKMMRDEEESRLEKPSPFQRATVLVVDDDPDVRAFLTGSLGGLGYHAIEAEDGPAALRILDRTDADIIVLDFAMPGMNGAEVAKRVWERLSAMPIIFASGYSESAAINSVQGEPSRLLQKPFKIEELQVAISELLQPQINLSSSDVNEEQ